MLEIKVKIEATEIVNAIMALVSSMPAKRKLGGLEVEANQQQKVTYDEEVNENIEVVETSDDSEDTNEVVEISDEEMRKLVGDFASTKGKDYARKLLKMFNVNKVSELSQKQRPLAIQAIKAVE